jgi:WD40 repeat protein
MGGIAYSSDSASVFVPAKYSGFPGSPTTPSDAPIRKISLVEGGAGGSFVGPGTFWTVAVTTDRVAGGTEDGRVMVWDSSKPSSPIKTWQVALGPGIGVGIGIVSLGWLGDGKHLLAMSMNGEGGVFGVDGTKVASLDRRTDGFVAVGWSADGSRLGVGRWNQTIEVFDLSPWSKP